MGIRDAILARRMANLDRADLKNVAAQQMIAYNMPTNAQYLASRNRLIKNNLRGMARTMGFAPSEQTLNDYVNVINYNNPTTAAIQQQLNQGVVATRQLQADHLAKQQAIARAKRAALVNQAEREMARKVEDKNARLAALQLQQSIYDSPNGIVASNFSELAIATFQISSKDFSIKVK